jgi:hypothetical protein
MAPLVLATSHASQRRCNHNAKEQNKRNHAFSCDEIYEILKANGSDIGAH